MDEVHEEVLSALRADRCLCCELFLGTPGKLRKHCWILDGNHFSRNPRYFGSTEGSPVSACETASCCLFVPVCVDLFDSRNFRIKFRSRSCASKELYCDHTLRCCCFDQLGLVYQADNPTPARCALLCQASQEAIIPNFSNRKGSIFR